MDHELPVLACFNPRLSDDFPGPFGGALNGVAVAVAAEAVEGVDVGAEEGVVTVAFEAEAVEVGVPAGAEGGVGVFAVEVVLEVDVAHRELC